MVTKDDLLDGLVSYYKLDETSGTTAVDSHGSNDGTANRKEVFTSEVAGIVNTGADISTADDDIGFTSADWEGIGDEAMSFFGWVNIQTDITGFQTIVGSDNGGAGTFAFQYRSNEDAIGIDIWTGEGTGSKRYVGTTDIPANEWVFVGFTKPSGADTTVKFYVGTESGGLSSENIDSVNSQPGRPGSGTRFGKRAASYNDQHLRGYLDEVGIWSRALSSDEVSALYDIQKDGYENGSYPFTALDLKIKGVVKKNGVLISGAKISCINQTINELVGSTTSDENGEWEFSDLNGSDLYHVVASLEDGEDKFNHLSYYDIEPKEEEE